MKVLRCFAPTLLLLVASAARTLSAEGFLTIINPLFANIPVECSVGYALQARDGGTCSGPVYPQQAFNGMPGIGWGFLYVYSVTPGSGAGLTIQNANFATPSFANLPFSQAVYLQNAHSEVYQTIFGFVAGQTYRLSFYLGSRYAGGCCDGNQTVVALIDDRLIGRWSLVSYTPFTPQAQLFRVATGGPHTLRLVGTASGDHTAFLSDVSIEAVGADDGK
jgi:hypothetical protein